MPYYFSYTNLDWPAGKLFSFAGIGSVPNGSTIELTVQQEKTFLLSTGKSIVEAFKNVQDAKVFGDSLLSEPIKRKGIGGEL